MNPYEEVPVEFLVLLYNQILNNINKGILSKNMYYELAIILSVANKKGIILIPPPDLYTVINQNILNKLLEVMEKSIDLHTHA